MPVSVTDVVEEAIRYEHNLATLYQAFSNWFPDDKEIWWQLSLSEKEHAVLLESGRALFREEFAEETVPADLEALRQSNDSLESILDDFEKKSPTREEAFRVTLDLERDANEMTLHQLLKIDRSQPASEIVTRIHEEDATHEQQIRAYAGRNGIPL